MTNVVLDQPLTLWFPEFLLEDDGGQEPASAPASAPTSAPASAPAPAPASPPAPAPASAPVAAASTPVTTSEHGWLGPVVEPGGLQHDEIVALGTRRGTRTCAVRHQRVHGGIVVDDNGVPLDKNDNVAFEDVRTLDEWPTGLPPAAADPLLSS